MMLFSEFSSQKFDGKPNFDSNTKKKFFFILNDHNIAHYIFHTSLIQKLGAFFGLSDMNDPNFFILQAQPYFEGLKS